MMKNANPAPPSKKGRGVSERGKTYRAGRKKGLGGGGGGKKGSEAPEGNA